MGLTTRRKFGAGLAGLGTITALGEAQEIAAAEGPFTTSKVFAPALTKSASGAERWIGPSGAVTTGEWVGFHESVVPAGTPKVELHVIKHTELLFIAEGSVSFEHDGVVEHASAGSVLYVAFGTMHRVWNSGETAARYFVMQVGGDTKKQV